MIVLENRSFKPFSNNLNKSKQYIIVLIVYLKKWGKVKGYAIDIGIRGLKKGIISFRKKL